MKRFSSLLACLVIGFAGIAQAPAKIIYTHAKKLLVLGQLPGCTGYNRLPPDAHDKVRPEVWERSTHAAGVAILFTTNSSIIKIRDSIVVKTSAPNVPVPLCKGFDLYVHENGKWRFLNSALSSGAAGELILADKMMRVSNDYLLYLPPYSSVTSLEIGVESSTTLTTPARLLIDTVAPIVFYGTSITQGASASRPGMNYCALLSRSMNREVINLGIDGNGFFEKEVGVYIMRAKPSVVVLDCTPNSNPQVISKNLPQLVDYLKSIDPHLPILFVESLIRENSWHRIDSAQGSISFVRQQNAMLQKKFDELKLKYDHLYYLSADRLIGNDHDGTVDGTHLNDLGSSRMAIVLEEKINKMLSGKKRWFRK